MMESLRSATRNTGFERWLDATLRPSPQADAPTLPDDSPKVPLPPPPELAMQNSQWSAPTAGLYGSRNGM